ncbi:MAG: site-2 protease family protein, partial [Clostridiales bacterium]|nr:site-2 protease family protein [Clostridiales bacterium]
MFGNLINNLDINTILEYGTKILIIFMILPIHEFAHAWSAYKLGDNTAYFKGRLTLNPIAHIDPFGAILLFFTGFGWAKPVPVNPNNFKNPRAGMAITAAAGPISNLIVSFIAMIIYRIIIPFYNGTQTMDYLLTIIYFFISINIGLAIFNLLPIPPLDGSRILSYFTSAKFDRKVDEYQKYILIGFFVLMMTG